MTQIGKFGDITAKEATRLRKAGVRTTGSLLRRAATRRGRTELAAATSIPPRQLQRWANQAALLELPGLGSEYGKLLFAAGVDTVKDLRRRNATALLAKIIGLNGQKRVVRRLPTEAIVQGWIDAAKEMEPRIS